MIEDTLTGPAADGLEDALRAELAQGNRIIADARPILRHLLADSDVGLFGDAVVAGVRGMMVHAARQLLEVLAQEAKIAERGEFVGAHAGAVAARLFAQDDVLACAHALVLEAELAERLHRDSRIDPLLPPLLRELAGSPDPAQAAAAVAVLGAQARFVQHQRRMEWPLAELPGELFHKAMLVLGVFELVPAEALASARARLRGGYDEGQRRVGQITRLIVAMGREAPRALSLDQAGLAIFVTALGMASGQDRALAVLTLGSSQPTRLALALRAAGMTEDEATRQFLYLHPELALPAGFAALSPERAGALLAPPFGEPLAAPGDERGH